MALQTSGAISLANIQTEFGGSNPIAISEYYGAAAGVPTSGTIAISHFYGKSSQFSFTISSDTTNASLSTLATAAGWDGSSALVATINSGVYVYSTSTGTPALTVSGSYPAGVSLINNGYIVGMGGTGGYGYSGTNYPNYGHAGYSGGGALSVSSAISITNNGTIAGGGGGGGGGGTKWRSAKPDGYGSGGGGGGGRSGKSNSSGGPRGYQKTTGIVVSWGSAGSSGTVSSAGGGGSGTHARYSVFQPSSEEYAYYDSYGGAGGAGGGWGSNGSSGSAGSGTSANYSSGPGGGGAGGYAVSGNSNVTWNVTGTRLGAVS